MPAGFITQITVFGVSSTDEDDLSPVEASRPSGFLSLRDPEFSSLKNKAITYSVPGNISISEISRSLKVNFFSKDEVIFYSNLSNLS